MPHWRKAGIRDRVRSGSSRESGGKQIPLSHFLYRPGADVTFSDANVTVNTVNLSLRLGNANLEPYWSLCCRRQLKPGTSPIFKTPDGPLWAAFASKDPWKEPSHFRWV